MSGDARDFNIIEMPAFIEFFPARQGAEGNSSHSGRNIGGTGTIVCYRQKQAPLYATVWKWVHSLNVVIFPPVLRLVLDDPKQWPLRRLLINFVGYSWKTAGFRLNQYLSKLPSHVSGLGPAIMKIWTCGNSPRSGSQNACTRIKNVNSASRLSNFWNFFDANQTIPCCDWWPWTKPGYPFAVPTAPKRPEFKCPVPVLTLQSALGVLFVNLLRCVNEKRSLSVHAVGL